MRRLGHLWLLLGCLLLAMTAMTAGAAPRVRVEETWPAGRDLTLKLNQSFFLRIAYATDTATRIWARPYFQGKPAKAGSNPSQPHQGNGQAIGWFFLFDAGTQVDEVRISAGDGRVNGTSVVAVYRVRIRADAGAADPGPRPPWVNDLLAADDRAQRAAAHAYVNQPASASDLLFMRVFMLAMLAALLAPLAMSAWAAWKWRGGWRLLGTLPGAWMAFVALRIVVDGMRDPTSHNLWPFEVLIFGVPCTLAMLAMFAVRKLRAK